VFFIPTRYLLCPAPESNSEGVRIFSRRLGRKLNVQAIAFLVELELAIRSKQHD